METPQPDKTGMHILLKLASLVVILAGIHAAADIIVQTDKKNVQEICEEMITKLMEMDK